MEVKKTMDTNELRSLQEAYLEVVDGQQLDEGYEPMTPEREKRVERAKEKAYDKDVRAQRKGDNKEATRQFNRRIAMDFRTKMKKEEIEQVAEADSLAAMEARRQKRLAAQRKREGTTATGRDFGRDDSLSADQQKKRRAAEYKAGLGTKKEEVSVYDIVLSHLLDEGYADTVESAEGIMTNMSEEWRDSIVEGLTVKQQMELARKHNAERKPYKDGDHRRNNIAKAYVRKPTQREIESSGRYTGGYAGD